MSVQGSTSASPVRIGPFAFIAAFQVVVPVILILTVGLADPELRLLAIGSSVATLVGVIVWALFGDPPAGTSKRLRVIVSVVLLAVVAAVCAWALPS